MDRFVFLICLMAASGGAGGLANYLLLSPPVNQSKTFLEAIRFVFAGAIVAFVVPLFLSLAQSSLVKNIFDSAGSGPGYPDVLIFVGFCVVAGFASRAFMDTMTNKMMQMQNEVRTLSHQTRKADETATQAIEISEENADRVAEAIGGEEAARDAAASGDSAGKQPSERASAVARKLKPQEKAVLGALTRYSKRTQTGVARDAGIPRNQVGEIIDAMHGMGVVHFTTSANTGGPRVQLSPFGTDVLNAARPDMNIIDDRTDTPSREPEITPQATMRSGG